MGERGPAPKPTILKVIAGNPGKRDLNLDEPIPAPMTSIAAPPEVLADPVAGDLWTRLVPDLAGSGLARSVDWPLLSRYVLKLSRWFSLGEEIRRIRATDAESRGTCYKVTTDAGSAKWVEFPFVTEWRELDRDLRLDERAIGISPAARTKIRVPGLDRKDENDLKRDFFKRGPNYARA